MPAEVTVPGLTDPRPLSIERFPVRTREGALTRSAWRLAIDCAEGPGAIVLVEAAPENSLLRGEGVFLGWPQERLREAYQALLPRSDTPDFELNQLG
jgi:hypothetical protein